MFRARQFLLHGIRLIVVTVLLAMAAVSACAEAPVEIVDDLPITPAITDPLTILRMFCDFLRAGQIDAAVNLLADDVVLTDSTGQVFKGRAAVRAWLSHLEFDDTELCDIWLAGDQIAWTVRIYEGDAFNKASGWALIRQGKIAVLSFTD